MSTGNRLAGVALAGGERQAGGSFKDDCLHRLIVRDFGAPHGRFVGWVDRFFDESQTATREQLWQVVYEDGDKEDLNQTELAKYLQPPGSADVGEFFAVTFQEGPLGLTIGPADEAAASGTYSMNDIYFNNQGNAQENPLKVSRTWVINAKQTCPGRGLLSHSDSVVLMGWQSSTRNLDFDSCCKALRTLPRPLTVIFVSYSSLSTNSLNLLLTPTPYNRNVLSKPCCSENREKRSF